jgi:hypothetical protein
MAGNRQGNNAVQPEYTAEYKWIDLTLQHPTPVAFSIVKG